LPEIEPHKMRLAAVGAEQLLGVSGRNGPLGF
jgi:hypothetical protein